jgi:hypothetical protein
LQSVNLRHVYKRKKKKAFVCLRVCALGLPPKIFNLQTFIREFESVEKVVKKFMQKELSTKKC